MKYRVKDQLHVSALSPDTMGKGTEFEASKVIGGPLVRAGLVDLVGEDDEPDEEAVPAEKAEVAPENKAIAAAPANKASKGKAKAKA